jgi:predicted  nucleic acid-binding Zn-ribbon protein
MLTTENNPHVPVLTPVQAFHALKQELEAWREMNDQLTSDLESVQCESESFVCELQALREQVEKLDERLENVEQNWLSVGDAA